MKYVLVMYFDSSAFMIKLFWLMFFHLYQEEYVRTIMINHFFLDDDGIQEVIKGKNYKF